MDRKKGTPVEVNAAERTLDVGIVLGWLAAAKMTGGGNAKRCLLMGSRALPPGSRQVLPDADYDLIASPDALTFMLLQDKVAIEKDKVAIEKDKVAIEKDKVAVEKDKVAIEKDKVAIELLHARREAYDPDYVFSSDRPKKDKLKQTEGGARTAIVVKCGFKATKVCDGKAGAAAAAHFEVEVGLGPGSSAHGLVSDFPPDCCARKIALPCFLSLDAEVLPLDVLGRIKWSHVYWPVHFQKTIEDLHLIRGHLLNKQQDEKEHHNGEAKYGLKKLNEWSKRRRCESEQRYGVSGAHINLNQSNEDFLDKDDNLTVQKLVPHDDLHEMVKFGSVPMYTRIKHDQSKAMCDRKLFEALTHEEQVQDVQEEGMVLALERYLLVGRIDDPDVAYRIALGRICTTITKGWFREFAIDNYPEIRKLPKHKDLSQIAHDVRARWRAQSDQKTFQADGKADGKLGWSAVVVKEWFSTEELPLVLPMLKSLETGSDGTVTMQLDAQTELWAKLNVSNQDFEHDCENRYEKTVSIEAFTLTGSGRLTWEFTVVERTGRYDSNRDMHEYSFDQHEFKQTLATKDEDRNLVRSILSRSMPRELAEICCRYFHETLLDNDDLWARIMVVAVAPLAHSLWFDLRHAFDQYVHRMSELTLDPFYVPISATKYNQEAFESKRRKLGLSPKQRRNPFYNTFLLHS